MYRKYIFKITNIFNVKIIQTSQFFFEFTELISNHLKIYDKINIYRYTLEKIYADNKIENKKNFQRMIQLLQQFSIITDTMKNFYSKDYFIYFEKLTDSNFNKKS